MAVKIRYTQVPAKSFDRRELERDFKETRKFDKVKQSKAQQNELKQSGFTPVLSSWVSAAGEQDGDLYVRFHNGNVYMYKGLGDLLPDLVRAVSPGRFMWKRVFRIKGEKVGNLPLKSKGEKVIDVSGGGLDTVEFIEAKEETLGFGKPSIAKPTIKPPAIRIEPLDLVANVLGTVVLADTLNLVEINLKNFGISGIFT